MATEMRFGSLFSGIGGLDLGLERAGMTCAWQVEIDDYATRVLTKHWPGVPKFRDVRSLPGMEYVDAICGGDPCPIRSRARCNGASRHADLSGYFLAVVERVRPRWVVRENVPAPDDVCFDAALGILGYGTAVIRMDAAEVTGQSRQRDFIVGCYQATRPGIRRLFQNCSDGSGPYTTRLGTRPVLPALTTHRTRYDSRDSYVWETDNGLRILDGDEREALAGFPAGWTAGLSEAARAKCLGNAVVPQVAEWIGRRIMHGGEVADGN